MSATATARLPPNDALVADSADNSVTHLPYRAKPGVVEGGVLGCRWEEAVWETDGRADDSGSLPHDDRDIGSGQLARVLSRNELRDGHRRPSPCCRLRQHRGHRRNRAPVSRVRQRPRAGAQSGPGETGLPGQAREMRRDRVATERPGRASQSVGVTPREGRML
jgi:hypothetical protein